MQPRSLLPPTLFLALALYSLSPVLPEFNSAIPAPAHGSRTVPLFNAWTILWNSLQLHEGFPNYWHAPIFFPQQRAFAFSEPQPATILVAPLKPHSNNPALAYNAWLLLSLTLNGLLAHRLLRWLDVPAAFAAAASAAIVLQPLLHHQLDSAQLVPLWPSIWTITALLQLQQLAACRAHSRRRIIVKGSEVGIAFSATAACALHHSLFLALLLLLTAWITVPPKHLGRWLTGAAAAAVAVLPILPLALEIHAALAAPHYTREESLITQLSVQPADFLRSPSQTLLTLPALRGHSYFPLNPGWLRLLAASAAVFASFAAVCRPASNLCSAKQSAAIRFLAALTLAAALLALGSRLRIGPVKLWPVLAEYLPGVAQVRSPFRFGYFYQTSLLLLAAPGIALLHTKLVSQTPLRNHPRLQSIAILLTAIAISCESLPGKLQLIGVPNPARPPAWVVAARQHLPDGHALLILPFAPNASAASYEDTTRRMIHATAHHIPLVNGYSGFFPPAYYELQKQLQQPLTTQLAQQLAAQNISAILSTSNHCTSQLLQSAPNSLSILWNHAPSQQTL
ncbi:MAG: hypothetical protein RL215_3110, partial [Planctomycetota bacterium]